MKKWKSSTRKLKNKLGLKMEQVWAKLIAALLAVSLFHTRMRFRRNLRKRKHLATKNQHASDLKVALLLRKVIKVIPMPQNVTDINLSTTISNEIIKLRTSATTAWLKVSSVYTTETPSRSFGVIALWERLLIEVFLRKRRSEKEKPHNQLICLMLIHAKPFKRTMEEPRP